LGSLPSNKNYFFKKAFGSNDFVLETVFCKHTKKTDTDRLFVNAIYCNRYQSLSVWVRSRLIILKKMKFVKLKCDKKIYTKDENDKVGTIIIFGQNQINDLVFEA